MLFSETGMEALLFVGYAKSNEGDESVLVVMRKNGNTLDTIKVENCEQADILYRLLTEQGTKAEIKDGLQNFIDEIWKQKKPGSPTISPVCADIIDILREGSEGSDE